MKQNPYTHQVNENTELQRRAREQNTFRILDEIAGQAKPASDSFDKKFEEESPQKMASAMPNAIPKPEEMESMAFDQEGNFVKPPIEGFWLNVLENINKSDPYKQGRDWRDDVIEKLKATKMKIDEMEAQLHGGMGQRIPSALINKKPPQQYKHKKEITGVANV